MSATTTRRSGRERRLVGILAVTLVALAAQQILLPLPLREDTRDQYTRKLDMITQAMQMYLADFGAFPPTNERAAVRRLLLPYCAPPDFTRPDRNAELPLAYSFPPKLGKQKIGDPAQLEFAEITLGKGDRIVSYIDAHLDILRPGKPPTRIPSWRERRQGARR